MPTNGRRSISCSNWRAGNRLESVGRDWLETLTLGLYDSSEAESHQTQGLYQHKQLQQAYKESVEWLLAAFVLTAAGLFLLSWLLNRRWIDLGYTMLIVALLSLLVGLTTPILSVEASKELPLSGRDGVPVQVEGHPFHHRRAVAERQSVVGVAAVSVQRGIAVSFKSLAGDHYPSGIQSTT